MSRLLFVDDNAGVCEVIALYLGEEGHQVTTCGDATTAQRLLERDDFDVAIIDVVLRGLSGLDLAKTARARGIYVILISGNPNIIDGLDQGAEHRFLRKPFQLQELGTAIQEAVGLAQASVGPKPANDQRCR